VSWDLYWEMKECVQSAAWILECQGDDDNEAELENEGYRNNKGVVLRNQWIGGCATVRNE
jgi:hypothetical protein